MIIEKRHNLDGVQTGISINLSNDEAKNLLLNLNQTNDLLKRNFYEEGEDQPKVIKELIKGLVK